MAWRIDSAVVRGEIDNTVQGVTTGKLWLIHQDEPIALLLQGDCWQDLAGTKLTFTNPKPVLSQEAPELSSPQMGQIGDMTASRKCKVFTDLGESNDFSWKNVLYLEWFDRVNGRVLIESADYELTITPFFWKQSETELEAQKSNNQLAMRDFISAFIQRSAQPDLWATENADEYAWEQRLRESDRLSDAFQEVLDKYVHDPDSQEKQAFAMGWDSMLGIPGLEDLPLPDPSIESPSTENSESWDTDAVWSESDDLEDDELDDEDEGDEFEDWDDYVVHPLQLKAQEAANMAIDLLNDIADAKEPAGRLCSLLMQVASKLAGALNFCSEEFEQEPGYVLAILKRCLHWQNDAIAACQELLGHSSDENFQASLREIRDAIFQVRDQITEMRRELKQN